MYPSVYVLVRGQNFRDSCSILNRPKSRNCPIPGHERSIFRNTRYRFWMYVTMFNWVDSEESVAERLYYCTNEHTQRGVGTTEIP